MFVDLTSSNNNSKQEEVDLILSQTSDGTLEVGWRERSTDIQKLDKEKKLNSISDTNELVKLLENEVKYSPRSTPPLLSLWRKRQISDVTGADNVEGQGHGKSKKGRPCGVKTSIMSKEQLLELLSNTEEDQIRNSLNREDSSQEYKVSIHSSGSHNQRPKEITTKPEPVLFDGSFVISQTNNCSSSLSIPVFVKPLQTTPNSVQICSPRCASNLDVTKTRSPGCTDLWDDSASDDDSMFIQATQMLVETTPHRNTKFTFRQRPSMTNQQKSEPGTTLCVKPAKLIESGSRNSSLPYKSYYDRKKLSGDISVPSSFKSPKTALSTVQKTSCSRNSTISHDAKKNSVVNVNKTHTSTKEYSFSNNKNTGLNRNSKMSTPSVDFDGSLTDDLLLATLGNTSNSNMFTPQKNRSHSKHLNILPESDDITPDDLLIANLADSVDDKLCDIKGANTNKANNKVISKPPCFNGETSDLPQKSDIQDECSLEDEDDDVCEEDLLTMLNVIESQVDKEDNTSRINQTSTTGSQTSSQRSNTSSSGSPTHSCSQPKADSNSLSQSKSGSHSSSQSKSGSHSSSQSKSGSHSLSQSESGSHISSQSKSGSHSSSQSKSGSHSLSQSKPGSHSSSQSKSGSHSSSQSKTDCNSSGSVSSSQNKTNGQKYSAEQIELKKQEALKKRLQRQSSFRSHNN